MKTNTLLIVLLILLPIASAYDTAEIITAEEIITKVNISSTIELVKKGPMYKVELLRAELYNYPKNDISQEVTALDTIPAAEDKADMLRYTWRSPQEKKLNYRLTSTVKTQNKPNQIQKKATYPVRQELHRGYDIFIKPTLHIDSGNPLIKQKAKEITQGETDLYAIVSKTANWVNKQVKYNISTKTEKATQKASWVMENKQGVCDEITALFIALLRAADIPARFVSGISYNSIPGQGETWGTHGWAEVYYPERGWLPYDITFGQYGRIDAGHIKLKEALDPRDKPTRFEWHGRDAGLESEKLNIDAKIKEIQGIIEPTLQIKTYVAKQKSGLNSYNLVIAEVKNLHNYYITEELKIAEVKEIEILGQKNKLAILKPNQTKNYIWRIKTKENLDQEYEYQVPIEIYTIWGDKNRNTLKIRPESLEYSLDEIVKLQDQIEKGTKTLEEIKEEEPEKKKQETKENKTKAQEKQKEIIDTQQEKTKKGIIQRFINWLTALFT